MKGIILAGGAGTRLFPSTIATSKQLLPVYDKPMVYYPLSTLILAGIREILLISTPEDIEKYRTILGDGLRLGLSISYAVQEKPQGIAQAFLIGEHFIGDDSVCLILGDNLFYGDGIANNLKMGGKLKKGALIFGYKVKDPERYGVVFFDNNGKVINIEEKPFRPKSNYAVPGIYFFDKHVVSLAKSLTPSQRGELEITDLNRKYLEKGDLIVELIGRGNAWLDTGTPDSLLEASNFIATIEKRQGVKIACLEEVAFRMGFIDSKDLKAIIKATPKSSYRDYLVSILD